MSLCCIHHFFRFYCSIQEIHSKEVAFLQLFKHRTEATVIASAGNRSCSNAPLIENSDTDRIVVPDKTSWKNLFAYMGPGFLVSIAYIDPGNFETDLQSGAQYKYGCQTVDKHGLLTNHKCIGLGSSKATLDILVASCAALVIQSLAANLGESIWLSTVELNILRKQILWVLAEISVVACDIPEVIGTAFALNMLFNIPIWIGVLLTGLSTLMLLALQQYGVRKLEFLIAFLEWCYWSCHSLLGAMVMPHNLFLHSALVLLGKYPRSVRGIKEACRFYMVESGFALMVAFLINVSVISVSGAVCNSSNLSAEDQKNCQDLDLNKASFLLRNVLGTWSSKLFAVALLASGQSSTITGTYAGQYVMQGFLDLRLKPWIRNFLTRCLAIVPSLIVAIIGGSSGAGKLIIIASMILSFELPFALIPLLKFTSSKTKMGAYANSTVISAITWIIGSLLMAINIYYLMSGFIKILLHTHFKLVGVVFLGILGFSGMTLETANEQPGCLAREDIVSMQLPKRRSTEDID
ncbi:hypothetical protein M0R45_031406 [Rubus argutus]|uniref:Uncharacterized protein n=1 Tax=Rubus argutus TaxID=59490 RepID=A0AAW1WDH3_RUBAR